MTIYLRQPYANSQASTSRRFTKLKKGTEEERISDKIEIDSDNIETPPATRKLFSPPKEVKPVEKEPCKRERCNGSFQSRDLKNAAVKNVNGGTDFGAGKLSLLDEDGKRFEIHRRDRFVSGNFDRYSAARRTRRYKKSQDSGEKESKQEVASTESFEEKPMQRPHTLPLSEEGEGEDFMLRTWQDKLKRREASSFDIDTALADIVRSGEDLQRLSRPLTHRSSRLPVSQPPPVVAVTNTVLSPVMQESRPREPSLTVLPERAVTSRERQRSMIDPSQVKEAIRLANNPPSQVNQINQNDATSTSRSRKSDESRKEERIEDRTDSIDDSKRRKTNDQIRSETTDTSAFHGRYVPDISVTSPPALPSSGKGRELEMNDEGFEETQSLVSETLSQETSSGNYETDAHDSIRCSPAELRYTGNERERIRGGETDLLAGSTVESGLKSSSIKSFDPQANAMKRVAEKSSFLPKRTSGVKRADVGSRKTESIQRNSNQTLRPNNNQSRNEVERSGSRSSLRSSRSSLNSATSVNTVRNLVPNHAHLRTYTSAICALTNDLRKNPPNGPPLPKGAEKRRANPRATVSRIPASRSSSSGSSVGPTARTVRKSIGVRSSTGILLIK